ncbi:TolC family protein [Chromatiaceae bacterium AAb-1]|nr:TolC family protein [Chromatiaceae bacterium AAb-1]
MRKLFRPTIAALSVAVLTACTVGADYQAPQQVADIQFSRPYQQAETTLSWWQAFDDNDLDRLVTTALQQNRTLAQARANVDRAYAVFRDARSDRLPSGSIDAGYQATENATLDPADDNLIVRGYRGGASLSWDLDLFGKLRRASEAAEAEAEQARILWHDAQLQLISQVATSYGEYRGAQLRLNVAQQNLVNLQQTRAIIDARLQAGVVSDLELARIDGQVYEVEASIPAFEMALLRADATLSALLGQQPGQLRLGAVPRLPELTKPVAIADGQNYLQYRADVAIAERALAASTARIGVATAELYPDLSISGFLGFVSGPGLSLGSQQSSWAVAPTLSWQGANWLSVRARINAATASQKMAYAEFEQRIIEAVGQMQLSLQQYNLSRQQQLKTEQQWYAANTALNIARARYNAGSGEFLELLDAERELLRSRDQVALLQQASFSRLVDIYRNFGGGISLI